MFKEMNIDMFKDEEHYGRFKMLAARLHKDEDFFIGEVIPRRECAVMYILSMSDSLFKLAYSCINDEKAIVFNMYSDREISEHFGITVSEAVAFHIAEDISRDFKVLRSGILGIDDINFEDLTCCCVALMLLKVDKAYPKDIYTEKRIQKGA